MNVTLPIQLLPGTVSLSALVSDIADHIGRSKQRGGITGTCDHCRYQTTSAQYFTGTVPVPVPVHITGVDTGQIMDGYLHPEPVPVDGKPIVKSRLKTAITGTVPVLS